MNPYHLSQQQLFTQSGYESVSDQENSHYMQERYIAEDVGQQQRQMPFWGPLVGGLLGQFVPPFGPPFAPPGPPPGPVGPPPGPVGPPVGAPTAPPPAYVPSPPAEIGLLAVDPGAIRGCLYRYTYVWLTNRQQFWFYPVFVGRTSVAGYRWTGFFWVYFGIDLRQISTFQCF